MENLKIEYKTKHSIRNFEDELEYTSDKIDDENEAET